MSLSTKGNIRCLTDLNFSDLMTPKRTEDQTQTTKEQISTEELVKNFYDKFLNNHLKDLE